MTPSGKRLIENSWWDEGRRGVFIRFPGPVNRGWQVVFMGADIDAYGEAGGMGIARDQTMSYAGASTGMAYASMSRSVADYSSGQSDTVTLDDVK